MTDEEKESDIYDICLEKKSLCCIRKSGEETCNKCKTYQMYKIGLAEGRKEKCLEQNKDGTIRPCELLKENEELKKEISVLLSCSNCSENKGGYVCEKEYNDKCLAQKIEYINELKEENAELKAQVEKMKNCHNCNGIINGIRQEKCKFCMRSKLLSEWELEE